MKQLGIRPLINFYNRLQKDNAYHTIAGLLLQNLTRIPNMMIQDVADVCFTSVATVSRLAKMAGYEGFNDMREQISKECSNYFQRNRIVEPKQLVGTTAIVEYLDAMVEMLEELRSMLDPEQVREAVEMIYGAQKVYYFGTVDSFNRLEQDLFVAGKTVDICHRLPEEAAHDWNEKVLVILSNPGYPWFNFNALAVPCKAAGAKVLMLSCTPNPEVEANADLTIHLPGTKSGRDETLFNVMMNIFSVEYRQRYMDQWYYQ